MSFLEDEAPTLKRPVPRTVPVPVPRNRPWLWPFGLPTVVGLGIAFAITRVWPRRIGAPAYMSPEQPAPPSSPSNAVEKSDIPEIVRSNGSFSRPPSSDAGLAPGNLRRVPPLRDRPVDIDFGI